MNNTIKSILSLFFTSMLFISCGGDKNNSTKAELESENGVGLTSPDGQTSNSAISQTLPSLMVFPSDALLSRLGFLKTVENQGKVSYQRNYQDAFISNPELKFAIAAIEEEFAKAGFPLENMEQQLKQIENTNAMDEMTDVARDLRAELLNTVRPDYIIELDFELTKDTRSRNMNKSLTYSMKSLDVYTNKAIASISRANVGIDRKENDIASLIKNDLPNSLANFKDQIKNHFSNLNTNGVEITLRVAISKNSNIKLDDECGDQELNERINNWMKENTLNQSFKMSKNTSTEMYFTSVRIKSNSVDGKKYTAYDFAQELSKAIKQGCSLKVKNKTQSIGDAMVFIDGSK